MNTMFVIVLYSPEETNKKAVLAFKNVLQEIISATSFSLYNNEIHILSDESNKNFLQETCEVISDDVNFKFLGDTYSDLDLMNQQLNSHIQRGIVSTDAQYYMVISSNLPVFNNRIFAEGINWDSDISIAFTQNDNSAMILFQKHFTPFFFTLSDRNIQTGVQSVTLFQQYKRPMSIIKNPLFYSLDNCSQQDFENILHHVKQEKNIYQTEIYRLLLEEHPS